VPHLRDGFIVAKVGIEQSSTAFAVGLPLSCCCSCFSCSLLFLLFLFVIPEATLLLYLPLLVLLHSGTIR
jgi:hypothetical protein